MWFELLAVVVIFFVLGYVYLNKEDNPSPVEIAKLGTHNKGDDNFYVSKNGFMITDRDTGHIFIARNMNGVISTYGIVPDRNLMRPLHSWRIGENPFMNNDLYVGEFNDDDGLRIVIKIKPDISFSSILQIFEYKYKKAN